MFCSVARVGRFEVRLVAAWADPGLERKARRVGLEHHEAVGLDHQARASGGFLPDDVAEDAALLQVVEQFRAVHLFLGALGDHGQRDQLAMRMLERGAGGLAVILEKQDVAEPAILLEIADAVLEGPQHLFDLLLRHLAQVTLWSGVSMITSWAPMPFILSYMPSPWRFSSPSMPRTGNLLGTTRTRQPGWSRPPLLR